MFMNLQISRTLALKNSTTMNSNKQTVSEEAMQLEWQEIQAAQQSPALFQPLYKRYYEGIFRFIYRRTSDESLSADICSQVFLKAMQKLSNYTYKGVPFSAWLYRIASNEVTQHFRNTQKNRVVAVEDQQLEHIAEEIDFVDYSILQQIMIDALHQLKPSDLELIELRYFEERPFQEIANLLDITESNAKVKTYRIIEKIKKIIASRPQND